MLEWERWRGRKAGSRPYCPRDSRRRSRKHSHPYIIIMRIKRYNFIDIVWKSNIHEDLWPVNGRSKTWRWSHRHPNERTKRYCSVLPLLFCFVSLAVAESLQGKKIHVHGQDTPQNYQILAHTYSFFMSAAADIKIQRDKDPEIQDTCLLSHTNDFW